MRFSAGLADLSLQGYRQLVAGCLGLKLQTNRPVVTPIFRTRRLQQAHHSFRYSFCFPAVAFMALRKNVLQEDDILCELYADARSDVSDNSDNGISDSDSDVSATASRKQLPSSVIVVTSNIVTSTVEEESREPENSDDKRSDVWCKTDKKPSNEPFLGTTGLNIVNHNPESVVEVVSSIIRDDLILLLN